MAFDPPRCRHGNILLGCPNALCPEQNAYVAEQKAALARWEAAQQAAARRIVRDALGLADSGKGDS